LSISEILAQAVDKSRFVGINDYIEFCRMYLEFIETGLQATVVSQNENQYRFFQYREDGNYNTTRPINSGLMIEAHDFDSYCTIFGNAFKGIKDRQLPTDLEREAILKFIYTSPPARATKQERLMVIYSRGS
jgi:hypothetical protein